MWHNSRKLQVLFQLCKQEHQFGLFDIFFNIRRTGLNLNKKKWSFVYKDPQADSGKQNKKRLYIYLHIKILYILFVYKDTVYTVYMFVGKTNKSQNNWEIFQVHLHAWTQQISVYKYKSPSSTYKINNTRAKNLTKER